MTNTTDMVQVSKLTHIFNIYWTFWLNENVCVVGDYETSSITQQA